METGHIECVRELLTHGYSTEFLSYNKALATAIEFDEFEIFHLLVDYLLTESKNDPIKPCKKEKIVLLSCALSHCASCGSIKFAKFLIWRAFDHHKVSKIAIIIDHCQELFESIKSRKGWSETIIKSSCLKNAPEGIMKTDYPFQIAVSNNDIGFVLLLLEAGFDPIPVDSEGRQLS